MVVGREEVMEVYALGIGTADADVGPDVDAGANAGADNDAGADWNCDRECDWEERIVLNMF